VSSTEPWIGLREALSHAADVPVLTAVQGAVVESTRLSREASPQAFLDRFRVLDEDPALRAETAAHPGSIKTPMMVEATNEGGGDALSQIFLGRLAEADEVSSLVLFLSSDESSYITAAEHQIDAGMSSS
jgi:hypothetical protein